LSLLVTTIAIIRMADTVIAEVANDAGRLEA
jgi:hypothetical protein